MHLLWLAFVLTWCSLVVSDDGMAQMKAIKEELSLAAQMPEESQKALLATLGSGLVASGQWQCNLFGGKKACTEVPPDSPLVKTCGERGRGRKVDCAFMGEAVAEMFDDPRTKMREKLAKEGYPPCDACFEALHAFWCGQTAPTCGTFEEVLDEILPALRQVAVQKASPMAALSGVFPQVLAASSLGLPCREMCVAVTSVCNCGHPTTVGQMMANIHRDKERRAVDPLGYSTNMSLSTAKELFGSVWNQPVCSLFAPKAMPGFIGVCDVPEKPPQKCGWCKGQRGPSDADQQIVAQMAQSMSIMMQGGVEHVLDAASNGKWSHVRRWDWKEDEVAKSKSHAGLITFLVLLFVFGGALAAGGVWYVRRRRQLYSTYVHLDDMGYDPPSL